MTFEEIRKNLGRYTVGIAGAGGLGSNCAVALARTGIGKLIISDFDRIDESNLNRQYYFKDQLGQFKVDALKENLERINPDVQVEIHNVELNRDNIRQIFENCEVIVEAFDRSDMKEMLGEAVISTWPDRPLVIGSGMAGWGKTNDLRERRLGDNLIVCGDEMTEVSEQLPPLAPRVAIVANMQANAVVDILLNS